MKPSFPFLVLFSVIFFVHKIKAPDPEDEENPGKNAIQGIDSRLNTLFKDNIMTGGEQFVNNRYDLFKAKIEKGEEKSMETFYQDLSRYTDKIKPLNDILTLEINNMVSIVKSIDLMAKNNMKTHYQEKSLLKAVYGFRENSFLYSKTLSFAKNWIDHRQPLVHDHDLSKTLIEIGEKLSGAQHYIDSTRNNLWQHVNKLLELISKEGKNWQGINVTIKRIKMLRKVSDFVSRSGIAYSNIKNIVKKPNFVMKMVSGCTSSSAADCSTPVPKKIVKAKPSV